MLPTLAYPAGQRPVFSASERSNDCDTQHIVLASGERIDPAVRPEGLEPDRGVEGAGAHLGALVGVGVVDAVVGAIFEYLEIFHNRQRRHSSIGMLTPIEFETQHHTRTA